MEFPSRQAPSRPEMSRLLSSNGEDGPSRGGFAVARMALWSVCYFAFYFGQQIAELLAPLLLVIGLGWAVLPHLIQAITTSASSADPQARDVMNHVVGSIPQQLTISGHVLTPTSLIFDGFLLMALAAIGATLSALAARNM
ncbi:hypothetical protein [Kozakia baliensis]|uniref:Uncharacterized protein n=1 Tax=Kozakia baliensis TaxID=153496 RepID=A0A1D8UUG0_9PROT|nr:hypothetical protein A0U89_09130 [Kozakia baliensis]GEL63307.1 hypothetical protein KBA01_05930 [Kozakia baliensis]